MPVPLPEEVEAAVIAGTDDPAGFFDGFPAPFGRDLLVDLDGSMQGARKRGIFHDGNGMLTGDLPDF